MKLLFDQNLSPRLTLLVNDLYPDSEHVRNFKLQRADDAEIWQKALDNGYVLVTKDEDYYARSLLYGAPPLVLWVRSGNCATELVETLLRRNAEQINAFGRQSDVGFLPLL